MSNTALAGRFERPSEVLIRQVGDELVVLNTASEQYHSLNDVGRRCYELLSDGHTIDEAVTVMMTEYETSVNQVRADLDDLVPVLLESGLLRSRADG